MKHGYLYAGAAIAAVLAVGAYWYLRRPASGSTAGQVAAGNKAQPNQPTSNIFSFGAALVGAGASAYSAYEKSNSSTTVA